jgi:hypothetical protein
MGENRVAIIRVQILDLVFSQAARGTELEVAGILIAKRAVLNFCPLSPIRGTVSGAFAKMDFGKRSELGFKRRKSSSFFETVNEKNNRTTVEKI